MNKIVVHKAIRRSMLGYLILCGLLGSSGTIHATAQPPDNTLASYDYTLRTSPHDVPPIIQKAYLNSDNVHKASSAAPLPLDQLLIPANGQCLYTTVIMGYLLPVRQESARLTTRIVQLFGCPPAYYLNKLHQTLQNPTDYLTYLHSNAFSALVTAFMARIQIKRGNWGGPQEIQTIANKLKVNIQAHYPDPSNRTNLVQSDLTKPTRATSAITLHIVRDKVHPAEVLTQTEKVSAEDNLHYQHYRLKYTLLSPIRMPVLSSQQPSIPHKMGSPQKSSIQPSLVTWFEAAKKGNIKLLEKLYKNYNINVNTSNTKGNTALLYSAYNGHLDCITFLVQQDANIHDSSEDNYTALLWSAYKGHLDCVKYLVQQGADINTRNTKGNTAFLLSAYSGHLDCLKYLRQQGAGIHDKNKKRNTALLLSAYRRRLACLKFLLQQGAGIHDKNVNGNTALILSAQEGHLDCLTWLVRQGARIQDKNKNSTTALILSAYKGHLACVKYLVQQDAHITLKGEQNKTALQWAAAKGHQDVVHYLSTLAKKEQPDKAVLQKWFEVIKAGNRELLEELCHNYHINVHTRSTNGNTALIESAYHGHVNCLKYLLQQGADIHDKNENKDTTLLWSAYNGHVDCLKYLVQRGADIHTKNETENTALLLSAYNGHVACLKYLVQQGADIHTKNKTGDTALILSAYNGHVDGLKFLLQQGAHIHTKNKTGDTALILSAYNGHLACVTFLVQQGADITLKGQQNKTALQWAAAKGQEDVVNFLSNLPDNKDNVMDID